MHKLVLTEREKEILAQLNQDLGLGMSSEEQRTNQGIRRIAIAVHSQELWSEDRLHDKGIALNSLEKIFTKAVGFRWFIPSNLVQLLGIPPRPKISIFMARLAKTPDT